MIDEDVINEFKTKRYRINPNLLKYYDNKEGKRFNKEFYEYIMDRYDDSTSFRESLCRIILGIDVHPKCPICGNPIPFKWSLNYKIFNDCCSQHCNNIYLNKLGKLNNKESIRKASKSRLKTLKEKYSVENSFQLESSKEKIKESNLKKYGIYPYSKSNNFKQFIKENILSINDKRNKTKKINNSFNTSNTEDKIYELLSQYYEVQRNWNKDLRYPWMCDFYIKNLDLFIECNFHWTHGGHPFDPTSIKDQVKLEQWKSKGTKYYVNAIKTWTTRDVNKRNKARKEGLRYVELWSYEGAMKYINENLL